MCAIYFYEKMFRHNIINGYLLCCQVSVPYEFPGH